MSAATQLEPLYSVLGGRLRNCFKGWKVAVLTGDAEASRALGLAIQRKNRFYNADLPVTLLRSEIYLDRTDAEPDGDKESAAPGTKASTRNTSKDRTPTTTKSKSAPKTGSGFRTRLQKNLEELRPWAERAGIRCYRLYNRDVPEYAVAIDLFDGWVHVQAYEAPRSVDPKLARDRLREVLQAIPEVLQIGPDRVYLKERRRQRGRQQYEKLAEKSELRGVRENGHRFLVNLTDYLDTGLFLDHRKTRALVGSLAHDRRFLNLFAYTGTATVYAVRGGAAETVTVDISNTYTEWSEKNLKENGIAVGERHSIVRDDCLAALTRDRQQRYGLIFCDPPTFSNSKKMRRPFDVQKDHVWLLKKTARLLDRNGILIFSNNYRKFVMDKDSLKELEIEDITAETLPRDFERTPNIHNCWRITRSR